MLPCNFMNCISLSAFIKDDKVVVQLHKNLTILRVCEL